MISQTLTSIGGVIKESLLSDSGQSSTLTHFVVPNSSGHSCGQLTVNPGMHTTRLLPLFLGAQRFSSICLVPTLGPNSSKRARKSNQLASRTLGWICDRRSSCLVCGSALLAFT